MTWDPSHEDPDEKTRKLKRELDADIVKVGYIFLTINFYALLPFVWVWNKVRSW